MNNNDIKDQIAALAIKIYQGTKKTKEDLQLYDNYPQEVEAALLRLKNINEIPQSHEF